MPFWRAIEGALTILISDKDGFRIPDIAADVIGAQLKSEIVPTYSISILLKLESISCPANNPSCSESLTNGPKIGASSALIDGIFKAFVTAPSIR